MPINSDGGQRVDFDPIELRSIKGVGRDLAWRIKSKGPYNHIPHKPQVIQEELQRVRGVGSVRAGKIYLRLIEQ